MITTTGTIADYVECDYVIVQRPDERSGTHEGDDVETKSRSVKDMAEHGKQSTVRVVVGNASRCPATFHIRRIFGFGTSRYMYNAGRRLPFAYGEQHSGSLAMGSIDDVD
jgi:hypothetical protein